MNDKSPILTKLEHHCVDVSAEDCEQYQRNALVSLDQIISSNIICHNGQVYERDMEVQDIAYDLFYDRGKESIYKKLKPKFALFHMVDREAHILKHLIRKGAGDCVPKLLEEGSDFIVISYTGVDVNHVSTAATSSEGEREDYSKQIESIQSSMRSLSIVFSHEGDQHFTVLNGKVSLVSV